MTKRTFCNTVLTIASLVGFGLGQTASAVTIGDPSPSALGNSDNNVGSVYTFVGGTFGTDGIATSVNFFGDAARAGNDITFMVGTYDGTNKFTPTGIFDPIVNTGGLQHDALVLAALPGNSAAVTPGETFAWKDGTVSGNNNGSIEFTFGGSFAAGGQTNLALSLGTALETNSQGAREYAVNMTAVPEPSSILMIGLGAAGLIIAARRRRKA